MHQAFDLAKALDGHGLSIRTLSVYGMEARPAFSESLLRELKAGRIDGTILMSARTAEILVSLCRKHNVESRAAPLVHFCLSTAVAERLAPLKPVNVWVAERPTRETLLALIAAKRSPGAASFSDHD
jgi:uroporphyrinogen-III synthase